MKNTDGEEWRAIPGYEGSYEVSDLGRVRSLTRLCSNGRIWKARIRKPVFTGAKWKYWAVILSSAGKVKLLKIHTAVLLAFGGPRPEGSQCRHLDGDKNNNSAGNLAWGSPRENTDDKHRHDAVPRGENHFNARMTSIDAERIRDLRSAGHRYHDISVWLRLTPSQVSKVCRGERWA
jgi:NUMOD4 motif/HNH endonuclease